MAILLDAHVHYHSCFDAKGFLDAAWRNLRPMRQSGGDHQTCLCLTEAAGERALERLHAATTSQLREWRIDVTAEVGSLAARRSDGAELLLVAGRQIVTRDGLEVLALGGSPLGADGAPIRDVIEATRTAGAVPVLPWGFGKWTLGRGATVAAVINESRSPDLFLGDNGGRAALLPPSPLFRAAAARAIWVLPGSDPLPFPSQQDRVGSYGCVVPGSLATARPAASLIERLRALQEQPHTFGRLQRLWRFAEAQLRMQWHKHRRVST
jgi:hypothetical protein